MAGCPLGECFAFACRVTDATLISQMKAIEDENRRLKRMYADLSMQADLLHCEGERHWSERT